MKYSKALDDLLGQKSKLKILRHLSNTKMEMSGRQIASEIGMSPWVCHQALKELSAQGAVLMRNVGNTHLFRINERNYLVAKVLMPLFEAEEGLLDAAISEIVQGLTDRITSIVLYGSISGREEKPSSDFDLLVLVPTSHDKKSAEDFFAAKNDYFISRFGNVLSPLILSAREFQERYGGGDPLTREIISTGRAIYGKSISEVISYASQEDQN